MREKLAQPSEILSARWAAKGLHTRRWISNMPGLWLAETQFIGQPLVRGHGCLCVAGNSSSSLSNRHGASCIAGCDHLAHHGRAHAVAEVTEPKASFLASKPVRGYTAQLHTLTPAVGGSYMGCYEQGFPTEAECQEFVRDLTLKTSPSHTIRINQRIHSSQRPRSSRFCRRECRARKIASGAIYACRSRVAQPLSGSLLPCQH